MAAENEEFRKEFLKIKSSLLANNLNEERLRLENEKIQVTSQLELNLALKLSQQALKLQKFEHRMKKDNLESLYNIKYELKMKKKILFLFFRLIGHIEERRLSIKQKIYMGKTGGIYKIDIFGKIQYLNKQSFLDINFENL